MNEVQEVASYKFAGQNEETRFNNLFKDRVKCKHPHGYMQVATEKECYYPGETVHGVVYFQLITEIPKSFLNIKDMNIR